MAFFPAAGLHRCSPRLLPRPHLCRSPPQSTSPSTALSSTPALPQAAAHDRSAIDFPVPCRPASSACRSLCEQPDPSSLIHLPVPTAERITVPTPAPPSSPTPVCSTSGISPPASSSGQDILKPSSPVPVPLPGVPCPSMPPEATLQTPTAGSQEDSSPCQRPSFSPRRRDDPAIRANSTVFSGAAIVPNSVAFSTVPSVFVTGERHRNSPRCSPSPSAARSTYAGLLSMLL